MLWDSIFNFFVRYVFGGIYNNVSYDAYLYQKWNGTAMDNITTKSVTLDIFGVTLPLGNYLSLIATIISISIIVILCFLFVYKIIKLIGGLIR